MSMNLPPTPGGGPSAEMTPGGAPVGAPVEAVRRHGSVDVLRDVEELGDGAQHDDPQVDLLLVGVGAMASTALEVADKLFAEGRRVLVVDPRWVLPVSDDLVDLARRAGRVAVVEDSLVGGIAGRVEEKLMEEGVQVPVHAYGIPHQFLDHGSRGQVLDRIGLTADPIAGSLSGLLATV